MTEDRPAGRPDEDLWDQQPHDPEYSAAQIDALLRVLQPAPMRVLDLGCGAGRVLLPLLRAGHRVIGADRSRRVLEECEELVGSAAGRTEFMCFDFTQAWPDALTDFDAICCLGNTFMTLVDVDIAASVLRRAAAALTIGGRFIIDDIPGDLWPELTEGNWCGGLSDDPPAQIVWHPTDAVFAVRYGDRVDADAPSLKADDRRYRLWTDGALRLAASGSRLSAPQRGDDRALLIMQRADGACPGPSGG